MRKPRINKGQWSKGQSGNPNGRPLGSRNKAKLMKAQLDLDNMAGLAVQVFAAMMSGNAEELEEVGLKPSEVTAKLKLEAAKVVIAQAASSMKALDDEDKKNSKVDTPTVEEKPKFSRVSQL